tara:strand:+ start:748 stop:1278 length:531 start_codon:yes stop_codon:yes gene_type:complete
MIFEARKDRLIHNNKIEVRKSKLHGYGVFAREFIQRGEILEECHLIEISESNPYAFIYPKATGPRGGLVGENKLFVLPTGFAAIYNSARDAYGANANWTNSGKDKHHDSHWPPNGPKSDNIFIFKAIKDIQKDEEILTDYSTFIESRQPTSEEISYSWKRDITDNFVKRTKPKPKI